MKSLLSFGQRTGYLPLNVGAAVKLPPRRNTLAERILTEPDVVPLLAREPNHRKQVLPRLLYYAGLRVSEIAALKWRDLEPWTDGGQVTVFGKGGKTRVVLNTVWRELLLEVKCWAGRIECGHGGHAWARQRRGLLETLGDPAGQLEGQLAALTGFWQGQGCAVAGALGGLLVFVHPRCQLEVAASPVPAVRPERVLDILRGCQARPLLSEADQARLVELVWPPRRPAGIPARVCSVHRAGPRSCGRWRAEGWRYMGGARYAARDAQYHGHCCGPRRAQPEVCTRANELFTHALVGQGIGARRSAGAGEQWAGRGPTKTTRRLHLVCHDDERRAFGRVEYTVP